jgi:DNA-binding NarL/FixJ family response regulator
LKLALSSDKRLEVVLEVANGEELLAGVENNMPDVVLMDLNMPVLDGIEATKAIKKRYRDIKVLIVTIYDDEKFIIHLMQNGASGYMLKTADIREIRQSIYAVHDYGYYFNDLVNKARLKKSVDHQLLTPTFDIKRILSKEELRVLKQISGDSL